MTKLLSGYRIGFLYGFLFGVFGLWILAVISMMMPFIEFITQPLFIVGRFGGSMLEENGVGSTMDVILLVLLNGVFYGFIGMGVQWIVNKVND